MAVLDVEMVISSGDYVEQQTTLSEGLEVNDDFDHSRRAQWLRAAVLGASDGLVSTTSLMMGVGAVKEDIKVMILTGFAGLVAGACSMAIGEFVSVYSQLDIEMAHMKREKQMSIGRSGENEEQNEKEVQLPSPVRAVLASALAFSVGAAVPLLAASFIREYKVRIGVVLSAASLALIVFGVGGAILGRTPAFRASVRVLFGGWLAIALTFGLSKLLGFSGL